MQKSALIDLVQISKEAEKFPHLIVYMITDRMKQGVVTGNKWVPIQHSMFADDNLLADVREQLKNALACSVESFCMLLGETELQFHRSLLSMDKHFKTARSYARMQLGVINTRNLTLRIPDNDLKELIKIL